LDTEVTVEEIEHCIKAMKLGRSARGSDCMTWLNLSVYAMGVESWTSG